MQVLRQLFPIRMQGVPSFLPSYTRAYSSTSCSRIFFFIFFIGENKFYTNTKKSFKVRQVTLVISFPVYRSSRTRATHTRRLVVKNSYLGFLIKNFWHLLFFLYNRTDVADTIWKLTYLYDFSTWRLFISETDCVLSHVCADDKEMFLCSVLCEVRAKFEEKESSLDIGHDRL